MKADLEADISPNSVTARPMRPSATSFSNTENPVSGTPESCGLMLMVRPYNYGG